MQNPFLTSTINMIRQNGAACIYIRVEPATYDFDTGLATPTEFPTNITAYKKHIAANQFNYPNMIGKDMAEFYVAANSFSVKPKASDRISFGGESFSVLTVREYHARGSVVLYTLVSVKA